MIRVCPPACPHLNHHHGPGNVRRPGCSISFLLLDGVTPSCRVIDAVGYVSKPSIIWSVFQQVPVGMISGRNKLPNILLKPDPDPPNLIPQPWPKQVKGLHWIGFETLGFSHQPQRLPGKPFHRIGDPDASFSGPDRVDGFLLVGSARSSWH